MDSSVVTATHSRDGSRGTATRDLRSFTATIEKRVLVWMAHRLPRAINSDHLTGLALVAMLGAGLSYWLASVTPLGLLLASAFLAVNWFGDSLDGTVARVRNHQRPRYGFYVDHVVDAFGVAFLFGGMALSGYMSPAVAIAILVAYFMLCIEVFLATHVLGTFRMSYFNVGPTELRVLLVVGNLYAMAHPTVSALGATRPVFDLAGMVGVVGLALTLVYAAITNTRRLYRLEPIPGSTR